MAENRKQNPPPAPPAAAAPAESHDKSALDDIAKPYVQSFVAFVLKFFADHRAVDSFLRNLSPVSKAGVKLLPGAVAAAVRKMPDAWFKSPELSHFARDIIVEAARKVSEIVEEKGTASAEHIENAVKEAEQAAMDRVLKLDPLGHVHVPECARLSVFVRTVQSHPRNRDQQPQQQTQSSLVEVKLRDAMSQGLKASPCCTIAVQEAVAKASAAPKSAKKNRSPLEIIGSIKDETLKGQFKDWLSGLAAEDRKRAFTALRELDSEEEFIGFMAMDPANRLEFLPLLEERNGALAAKKYLGVIGTFLKNGWNLAVAHYTEWNDSLAPEVERLRRKYHDEDGNVITYKKPGWGTTLRKILGLSPF